MEGDPNRARAIWIGRELARKVFDKRGNHAEVHLNEGELAAMIALGVEDALRFYGGSKVKAVTARCSNCGAFCDDIQWEYLP